MAGNVIITDRQKVSIGASPVDVDGQPIALASPPSWESSNPDVVSLIVAEDGLSAVAVSGLVGEAVVTVSLGELSDTLNFQVINSEPGALNLTVGVPEQE